MAQIKIKTMTREELLKEFPTLSDYMIEKVLQPTSLEQAMESMRTQHIPFNQQIGNVTSVESNQKDVRHRCDCS